MKSSFNNFRLKLLSITIGFFLFEIYITTKKYDKYGNFTYLNKISSLFSSRDYKKFHIDGFSNVFWRLDRGKLQWSAMALTGIHGACVNIARILLSNHRSTEPDLTQCQRLGDRKCKRMAIKT